MKYVIAITMSVTFGLATLLEPIGSSVAKLSEKIPILLAVLLASVFVRLARGLPTMPYEKVSSSKALIATRAFRFLIVSYVQTLVVFLIAIVVNLVFATAISENILPDSHSIILVVVGSLDAAVIMCMIFLVTSDVQLATLQADLIDKVTSQIASKSADSTVDTVKAAFEIGGRKGPYITQL